MIGQTPDLVPSEGLEWHKEYLEHVRVMLERAQQSLQDEYAKSHIRCAKCTNTFLISTQEVVQTHWYTRPHGCTGGDYWNTGEIQWWCPTCQFCNRFDGSPDKGYRDFYRPELMGALGLFKYKHRCYCEDMLCTDCRDAGKGFHGRPLARL